jgi:hypothetical protein
MTSIDCSGYDLHQAAMLCGEAIREGEDELAAARRNTEGHKRLRLIAAHRALILEAALEEATSGRPTAVDLWDAICDLYDAKGALHRDDFLVTARRHGLR